MRTPAVLTALLIASAALSGCAQDEPAARATAPATPSPTPEQEAAGTLAAPTRDARLTGDGVDLSDVLVEFGAPLSTARASLEDALGTPTADTGPGPAAGDYGTCPGTLLQALEYGDGALVVLFGDVDGPELTMHTWLLRSTGRPADVPRASALVGDAATYEFGVGEVLADLRAGAGAQTLTVTPGDELVEPGFVLRDQSSGFVGTLTGPGEQDTVVQVVGGQGCGE